MNPFAGEGFWGGIFSLGMVLALGAVIGAVPLAILELFGADIPKIAWLATTPLGSIILLLVWARNSK